MFTYLVEASNRISQFHLLHNLEEYETSEILGPLLSLLRNLMDFSFAANVGRPLKFVSSLWHSLGHIFGPLIPVYGSKGPISLPT